MFLLPKRFCDFYFANRLEGMTGFSDWNSNPLWLRLRQHAIAVAPASAIKLDIIVDNKYISHCHKIEIAQPWQVTRLKYTDIAV